MMIYIKRKLYFPHVTEKLFFKLLIDIFIVHHGKLLDVSFPLVNICIPELFSNTKTYYFMVQKNEF